MFWGITLFQSSGDWQLSPWDYLYFWYLSNGRHLWTDHWANFFIIAGDTLSVDQVSLFQMRTCIMQLDISDTDGNEYVYSKYTYDSVVSTQD
jgi:hypothetical protein